MKANVLTVAVVLSGCAAQSEVPLQTDAVKDEATAIRLGQEACEEQFKYRPSAHAGETWHAQLEQGVWHAWRDNGPDAYLKTDIEAATGKTAKKCTSVDFTNKGQTQMRGSSNRTFFLP
jgi:hypothetical protein